MNRNQSFLFPYTIHTDVKNFVREIKTTEDGSKTIYLPEIDETYHSTHGALQEALHVFIQHGFHAVPNSQLRILEIGFGTGLNALLTCIEATHAAKQVYYVGLEAFPVEEEIWKAMDYPQLLKSLDAPTIFEAMHQSEFEISNRLTPNFELLKIAQKLEDFLPESEDFDLIYFDAFGPRAQADMWQTSHFQKLFNALKTGGVFVTYCAKGQVKRDLKAIGFNVESLPGPPGKREMTRCIK